MIEGLEPEPQDSPRGVIGVTEGLSHGRGENLKLMSAVTPLESPADVERLAEAILRILENHDGQTKIFIR
jgi:hypothetical protein